MRKPTTVTITGAPMGPIMDINVGHNAANASLKTINELARRSTFIGGINLNRGVITMPLLVPSAELRSEFADASEGYCGVRKI